MPASSVFRIGEEVEVSSTEEGFQGSWYEATVARSHLNRRFYDVQYATLLADDGSSRPLVESVRASHLRPRAPRLAPAAGYAVEDLVDGFHNDGWWPGIVSATDGSAPPRKYTVCFPSSREVVEFAPSEIRPRLQWRHGRWLPHENMDVKWRPKAEINKKRSGPRKQSTERIISMNAARMELEQSKRTGNGDADSKDTNKGVTLSNRDLLHNGASNTKANTQVGQQVAQDLIQDGTSPSFFKENVQEISSFANGLNDTAIEVETRDLPPTLKEDCALAPDLTPRMASFAQDAIGTLASFLTGNLQDVTNFTNGLSDAANDVENRSLSSSPEEDCTVARSNSYDPGACGTSRFGSMHDIEGVEAEIIYHQPESADVTDKNETSSMPASRSVNVEEMGSIDPSPVAPTIARTLPFVKHSSLWEEIDSMEIFRIMPQRPHFRALEQQYSIESLEGMAIGLMVTFANLETGMRKLDIFDSQASFEGKLKTLKQLEDNGFNIQSLQSRIQKLLDTRNSIHELQNQENRMKELMSKKDSIERERNGVDKRLMEAEKRLASLSEQSESLLAQQLELQKTLQATQEAYLCAKLQFHTIVASL